jgi:hypothetical protein
MLISLRRARGWRISKALKRFEKGGYGWEKE